MSCQYIIPFETWVAERHRLDSAEIRRAYRLSEGQSVMWFFRTSYLHVWREMFCSFDEFVRQYSSQTEKRDQSPCFHKIYEEDGKGIIYRLDYQHHEGLSLLRAKEQLRTFVFSTKLQHTIVTYENITSSTIVLGDGTIFQPKANLTFLNPNYRYLESFLQNGQIVERTFVNETIPGLSNTWTDYRVHLSNRSVGHWDALNDVRAHMVRDLVQERLAS